MHYKRWQRTGNPTEKGVANYKGNDVGYLTIHLRLRKYRGEPENYICTCGKPAKEWSYNHKDPHEKTDTVSGVKVPYSVDLDFYSPTCISCHRKLDHAPLV